MCVCVRACVYAHRLKDDNTHTHITPYPCASQLGTVKNKAVSEQKRRFTPGRALTRGSRPYPFPSSAGNPVPLRLRSPERPRRPPTGGGRARESPPPPHRDQPPTGSRREGKGGRAKAASRAGQCRRPPPQRPGRRGLGGQLPPGPRRPGQARLSEPRRRRGRGGDGGRGRAGTASGEKPGGPRQTPAPGSRGPGVSQPRSAGRSPARPPPPHRPDPTRRDARRRGKAERGRRTHHSVAAGGLVVIHPGRPRTRTDAAAAAPTGPASLRPFPRSTGAAAAAAAPAPPASPAMLRPPGDGG